MSETKNCKWCNGTGKAYSVYVKQYVVCDACKGTGKVRA